MPSEIGMTYVPPFEFRGANFSSGRVAEDITDLRSKRYIYELSAGSLTHGDQAALYTVGAFENYGIDTGVPEEARQAALRHYRMTKRNRNAGNVNNDSVYLSCQKPPFDKSTDVIWIRRPVWVDHGNGHVAELGPKSEIFFVCLPPTGYGPVPEESSSNLRHPDTGWVLRTEKRKTVVEKILIEDIMTRYNMDRTTARELALDLISFSTTAHNVQYAPVVRASYFFGGHGHFIETLSWQPEEKLYNLGSIEFNRQ